MFKRFRLGSLLGFPIEVNVSFLLLLAFVLLWMGGLAGLVVVGLAFASVLLHELGHAIVARQLGVRVSGIELHFFGGAAKMVDQPRTANHEVAIAAAGPAVSLVLGGLGLGLGALTGSAWIALIGWINLIVAAFNLMPALPMDGGRIFRALLTRKLSFTRATEIAVIVSRGFAILLGVYGLATANVQLALIAVVIWWLGSQELLMAQRFGHRFGYDGAGYRTRSGAEVEVLPRGVQPAGRGAAAGPVWGTGPVVHRVVVRRRGGAYVVEFE